MPRKVKEYDYIAESRKSRRYSYSLLGDTYTVTIKSFRRIPAKDDDEARTMAERLAKEKKMELVGLFKRIM